MIKNKTFLDLFWSFSDNLLQQIINFVVGIILARILLPEEFGLLGIITVFIALSNVFVDGGFSIALINKKNASNLDYNTVFYTNIITSILLYILLFISSDWLAIFFNNPEITDLLKVAGLNIILISLGAIHRTILVKKLNFKLISIISLIAVTISAFCSIIMAYNGFGVYSLVYRILIGQLLTVILFWILNKWRPSFEFSISSFKNMFGYGFNLLVSNILNTLHSNVYYLIIGKFFSPIDLGYYTRATTFRDLASTNISNTIKRVSFSTLSKIDNKKIQYQKFISYSNITYLLTSFSMLFLFFLSEEIIIVLLSDKWLPSAYLLKIISISGLFLALYNLNLDYLAVIGKTKLYLFIEILGKILIIPVVLIGILEGFEMFLYAVVVQNLLMYFYIIYKLKNLKIEIYKSQFGLTFRYLILLFLLLLIKIFLPISNSNIFMVISIKIIIIGILFLLINLSLIKNYFHKIKEINYFNKNK